MSNYKPGEWQQIEALFNQLKDLGEEEQESELNKAAANRSGAVMQEARLLLKTDRNMDPNFMEGNLRMQAFQILARRASD